MKLFLVALLGLAAFMGVGWYADQPMKIADPVQQSQDQPFTPIADLTMQVAEPAQYGQEVAPFGRALRPRVGHKAKSLYCGRHVTNNVIKKRDKSRHLGGLPMET